MEGGETQILHKSRHTRWNQSGSLVLLSWEALLEMDDESNQPRRVYVKA